MSDVNEDTPENWGRLVEQMNEAMTKSVEQNMEAQAQFMESWADTMEQSMPEEDTMTEGFEAYSNAYDIWMDAADQMFERTVDAAEGEDVSFTEFRDIWLRTANEAFKEVMNTSAFAAATGDVVENMMEMQEQTEEISQDTLSRLGLPTRDEMDEVGERLIELERRQHAVEEKLDRILAHLE
jgi:polyhydroxyalkanoate synthesis regulator phasin